MSFIHLQADTYPYRPGTTIRTGKPWSKGSGSPFMPRASIASRPSMTVSTGVPMVMPSTERVMIWLAGPPRDGGFTPASRSRSASRTPIHRALPTYGPPTSLDTQVRVMSRSMISRRNRSLKLSVTGRSTPLPWILSLQSFASMRGTTRAVSTR